jgi:uncharacterized protein (DUF2236 family)
LLLGGARAILLQVAHPGVAAGVASSSDFATRPMHRLDVTLRYVYGTVFGTAEQRRIVRRHVNRAHAGVPGGFDPGLQLWVAATLFDSARRVLAEVFGVVGEADAERMLDRYAVIATSLQVPAERWPADIAAFDAYWAETSDALAVGPDAWGIARELLGGRVGPLWLRAAMPTLRLLSAGLLPDELRAPYGIRWSARQQRRFDRRMSLVRAVYPRLPRRVREWPLRHYLSRIE